jgi:ABC-type lipoprotein export system ATPase subunit
MPCATSEKVILESRNLHKIYVNGGRELPVLKGIDLKVGRGEFLSIAGPSGAGKTTFLHLLGGIDVPTKGEVIFDGRDLRSLNDRERARIRNERIGFVFQLYHLLPELTALENVVLPGLIKERGGTGGDREGGARTGLAERGMELLDRVGLSARADHRPAKLSGGEQQRVAIARALMNDPDVVLCDEPTGNLDSQTGSDICELLCRLNRENRQTLIVVTHEEEIARRAHRVIHLRDGVLC